MTLSKFTSDMEVILVILPILPNFSLVHFHVYVLLTSMSLVNLDRVIMTTFYVTTFYMTTVFFFRFVLKTLLEFGDKLDNRHYPKTGLVRAIVKLCKLSCRVRWWKSERPGDLYEMAANNDQATPLIVASMFGRLGLVKTMLEHKADAKAANCHPSQLCSHSTSRGIATLKM